MRPRGRSSSPGRWSVGNPAEPNRQEPVFRFVYITNDMSPGDRYKIDRALGLIEEFVPVQPGSFWQN